MQSVLSRINKCRGQRALVYDGKQDMLSILYGMGLDADIVLLNPFDVRSAAWDIAADITTPAAAQEIASILIPEDKNTTQPFFPDSGRHLLTKTIEFLIRRLPGSWTLRDALLIAKSTSLLRRVLTETPGNSELLDYFRSETTGANILSTIHTKFQRYEFIAAMWEHAETKFSLEKWLTSESILVLGNDETTRSALDAINQVIFHRLSKLLIGLPESNTTQNWIFLDEVREAGRLEGLSSLLTKGRSKGVSVILGFQDIEGLHEVYGTKVANELTGQCGNKAILKLNSPETAKWASSLFGEREVFECRESKSHVSAKHGGSSGVTTSEQLVNRKLILDSQFLQLPATTEENGLCGYYISPYLGAYRTKLSGEWIKKSLKPSDSRVPNSIARPSTQQELKPWGDEDFERVGLALKNQSSKRGKRLKKYKLEKTAVKPEIKRKKIMKVGVS